MKILFLILPLLSFQFVNSQTKSDSLNSKIKSTINEIESLENKIDELNQTLKVLRKEQRNYLNNNDTSLYKNKSSVSSPVSEEYEKLSLKTSEEIKKSIDKGIPLYFHKASVTFNSIDNPEAYISLRNISEKTIDAYTLKILCYDRFDNPVKDGLYGDNNFGAISQETISPLSYNSGKWTLYGHENTAKIKVFIDKVHFTDGTTWRPSKGKNPTIEGKSGK
ncbi:MAG: hypothetical protein IPM56_03530 [Ignavibacteriales bacterium]|nr:MAG: hypothetical protein IPM56_03530 [Ignavibacteriales bacterium]